MSSECRLTFTMPEQQTPRKVCIKVVGTGGAGGNAVNRMIESGLKGVEFIAVNTDYQDLEKSMAPVKLQIGQNLTRGLGTGGNPERGLQAAIEDSAVLAEHLQGADVVFIAAGMGGGTGTGSAPVIAQLASQAGALTVAVVTKPFALEGRQRETNAQRGLDQLTEATATLIVIPNENLFSHLPEDVSLEEAFRISDDILRQGVQGISDLITRPGYINLDFEDARTVLSTGGRAVMGMGVSSGKDRATQAAQRAAHNQLLEDASIQGAKAILINFTSDRRLGLKEISEAVEYVRQKAHPDVNVLLGASFDESLGDELRVTVVAASFDGAEPKVHKKPTFMVANLASTGTGPAVLDSPFMDETPSLAGAGASNFARNFRRKDAKTNPEPVPGTPAAIEKDYEVYQTPPFLRKHRD